MVQWWLYSQWFVIESVFDQIQLIRLILSHTDVVCFLVENKSGSFPFIQIDFRIVV